MNVLVTGGRSYDDWAKVHALLDSLHNRYGITLVIQGGAGGADLHAFTWAQSRFVGCLTEKADWEDLDHHDAIIRYRKDGTAYDAMAGIRRNELMLTKHKPDIIIGFEGGSGTANMVGLGVAAGIPTLVIPDPDKSADEVIHIEFPDGETGDVTTRTEPYWAYPPSPQHKRHRRGVQTPEDRYEPIF